MASPESLVISTKDAGTWVSLCVVQASQIAVVSDWDVTSIQSGGLVATQFSSRCVRLLMGLHP